MSVLAGKNAVITGGETGIGLGIAAALSAAGAKILIGGILDDAGKAAVEKIEAQGGSAAFVKIDVRDGAQVEKLVQSGVDRFGRLDIMVNNAGVFDGFASCIDTSESLWDKVLDINLKGTFFGCQAALKHMVPQGYGRILNTASVGGLRGAADGASYTASKFAIVGLTRQIACTYAENGIAINAICPGVIETEIRANSTRILGDDAPKMAGVGTNPDGYKRLVPARRKGQPSEVGDLAVFLASDNAAYINGQAIAIDGGWDGDLMIETVAAADFDPTEESIVAAVRRFVSEAVRPNVAKLEREGRYPDNLVAAMRDLGLFGIAIAEKHGGLGLRLPVFAAVMEELAKGWTSLAAYVNSHSTVAYVISRHGTDEQQQKYLPQMASGALRGALCLTEPGAGSDLQSIQATALATGDGYTLNGNKFFVTNGGRAGLLLVLAKTDPKAQPAKRGISLMVVEKATRGVSEGSTFHKMAYGLVDTVEIRFEDATVPSSALLGGKTGQGLQQLFDGLEVGRIAIAASAVGLAADALNEAKRYASERKAFGATIDQHQAVQLKLADMATQLVAARLMTREAAKVKAAGGRADMISGMAKLFASEACAAIVGDALRIHGGYGYIADFPIERLYREAPLYIVGEGTNDIQKLVIARRIIEDQEAALLGLPE